MAKKKKTQLKPVARGFATTSVPKKVVETPALDESVTASLPPSSGTQTPAASQEPAQETPDPASVQEQLLQNVVDKLQDKTEKEISR
jgi:ATP-dependent RNA helicase DHX29